MTSYLVGSAVAWVCQEGVNQKDEAKKISRWPNASGQQQVAGEGVGWGSSSPVNCVCTLEWLRALKIAEIQVSRQLYTNHYGWN